MLRRLRIGVMLAAGLCTAALSFDAPASARRFTVEKMLQNEAVGQVSFSADGEWLYYDRILPYRKRPRYDALHDRLRGLSQLHMVRVDGTDARVLAAHADDRTWYLTASPDGRYVVFGWLDGLVQRIGIFDHRTATSRRLSLLGTTVVDETSLSWGSDTTLVMAADTRDAMESTLAMAPMDLRQRLSLAERSWQGQRASVTVWGSGIYRRARKQATRQLVHLDVSTGVHRVIDEDAYSPSSLAAPRQGRSAWLRTLGTIESSSLQGRVMSLNPNLRELVIVDADGGMAPAPSCEDCGVERFSMDWSPDGARLFFSARQVQGSTFAHRHFVYDTATGRSRELRGLGEWLDPVLMEDGLSYARRAVWLDADHLLVRSPSRKGQDAQARWHLLHHDGHYLGPYMPRQGDATPDTLVATDGGEALMTGPRLWRLGRDGHARQVPLEAAGRVRRWCRPDASTDAPRPRPCGVLESGAQAAPAHLVLEVADAAGDVGWHVFEAARDRHVRVHAPPGHAPMAISRSGEAVFVGQGDGADQLVLTAPDGRERVLHRYNAHLAGLASIRPLLLERVDPEHDDTRNDWLLLPADHVPGQRRPLLVYFYPDTSYGKEISFDDVRTVSSMNVNLAAARGYAVLLASMRISAPGDVKGNPMREMHAQLVRAAENAVAQGYADPERWALIGHSYGGYGVNAVITQTDRFKAAIALAGPVNLGSVFASGLHYAPTQPPSGLPFGTRWAEGPLGRMGVPPWDDPQRYVDNSPLFRAGDIRTPLMLVHGDLDFVNVNEAEQMFNALLRQEKPAQLLRYWGEDHLVMSPENVIDLWNRIDGFLSEHIGASTGETEASIRRGRQGDAGMVDAPRLRALEVG